MTAIAQSVSIALRSAGRPASSVRGAVVAMAGLGLDVPLQPTVAESLGALGICADVRVESDAVAAFESGTHETSGYVVISGTGAAALRVDGGAVAAVADGLGWLIGDAGSGFWIGRNVALAAANELDGRGPATALTPLVLAHFDIDPDPSRQRHEGERPAALTELVLAVYRSPAISLARLASLAFDAADDAVSRAIVAESAEALATTLSAVMAPSMLGPVVATGGVLAGQRRLRAAVEEAMERCGYPVELQSVPDGLAGAVTIALRHAGIVVDARMHAHVRQRLGLRT